MDEPARIRVGEAFTPHRDARKLYYVYLGVPAVVVGGAFASAVAALLYFSVAEWWIVALALFVPYAAAVAFPLYWIPRYMSTVAFTLAEERVVYEGGVWWKRKSFVPYNRITNIDVMQGPVSRAFALGKVSIQTAGYSGQSSGGARFAEISIFGVKNFEAIKDALMTAAVRHRPVAVEAGVETGREGDEVVAELRRIRAGIEDLVKRG